MKELSFEYTMKDYEKKYKEALERAKKYRLKEDLIITQDIFPELKESEDERMIKSMTRLVKAFYDVNFPTPEGFTKEDMLAWLEKQGEQKPADKIQLGKKYKCIASPRYSTFMTGEIYKPEDKFLCSLMNFCYDCFEPIEDGEQKPADKVEPKFREGEWLVHKDLVGVTFCITQIHAPYYYLTNKNSFIKFGEEDNYRLWTIQDAKDGDVLATDDWVFIFEKINSNGKPVCHCHYDIELGFRVDTSSYIATGSKIYPATKEQRDQLEKAMADAGYNFDFEKKELKKIEQKPTNSQFTSEQANNLDKHIDKFLEQKPEWSEEDEEELKIALDTLEKAGQHSSATWLKNVCLVPQSQWKPSKGQLECLGYAIEKAEKDWSPLTNNRIHLTLKALKEQLLELRGSKV